MMAAIAKHSENPTAVVIAIEMDRSLFVDALEAAGMTVYAINPRAVLLPLLP